ncbi:tetratricopeptide repeat protein [Desulfatitalea tepidiphila]|uniref:tetratricopeptide repeat protein n=1 Tax=Desulfatitalea tepidiphila TaxID=1185843 RepID=UPI0006B4F3BE|nr:tetratricopeptide repeat protein [Desulfatitalea tepidiphila]
MAPQDPFGHRFRGYLHYRRKQYDKAVADLEAALQLNPEDAYAHFYLTYAYAGLYQTAARLDPQRSGYKERFRYHRERTRSFTDRHPLRVAWLNRSYPDGSRQGGD